MKTNVIESVKGKMGGKPVFAGTRVPISRLFAELEEGNNVDYFLKNYPTVTREQVTEVLNEAERKLLYEYETLNRLDELEGTVLVQQAGLVEVLGLVLSLLPDKDGNRLSVSTAKKYVKTALERGEV
jgi:uncharacterized protein (DUF433 family)